MSLSARGRMLVGFLLANGAIIAVAATLYISRPIAPPLIQGVLLSEARDLGSFSLLDHHGQIFDNSKLEGQWTLVSYGFTSCPDICPTTLSQLALAAARLEQSRDDLRIVFYSVDHRRDTVSQLATYLPFFDDGFVGLTHIDDPANPHLPFEQGLGIVARLLPAQGSDATAEDYQVLHGTTLFLINPRGELQAIFKPVETAPGVQLFDPDKLVADYLAVRRYVESRAGLPAAS